MKERTNAEPGPADLGNHAVELYEQGRYREALPIADEAVRRARNELGEDHPDFGMTLNNLAMIHKATGDLESASRLLSELADLRRVALGELHPEYATTLDNLAAVHLERADYATAERLGQQACEIRRIALGEDAPDYALSLGNLAVLYRMVGNYGEAAKLGERACHILLTAYGESDLRYAISLNNLGALYEVMGLFEDAERHFQRACEIRRINLGEDHPSYATGLNNLAKLYKLMGKYSLAVPLYRKALDILRTTVGEDDALYAKVLHNLAAFYKSLGNFGAAEPLYLKALSSRRAALGENHPDFAESLNNLAMLYKAMGRYDSAEPLLKQAHETFQTVLGEAHPRTAFCLSNRAALYEAMGNYGEAEPLFKQVCELTGRSQGKDHTDYALSLNNLGMLYRAIGRFDAAEPALDHALKIYQSALSENHPDLSSSITNLALLYNATDRPPQALDFLSRAAAIDQQLIGQVFSMGSQRQRAAFLESIRVGTDLFLSTVALLREASNVASIAFDWVLRRKGIGAEGERLQRATVLGGTYPHLEPALKKLDSLVRRIGQTILMQPGPGESWGDGQLLAGWQAQREVLEANIASQIPEMNIERRLRGADCHAVAAVMHEGTVLVEFVRFDECDFHAVAEPISETEWRPPRRWKPARYSAFVVSAGEPENILMIDLGEAEAIDGLIAQFRARLSGPDDRDITAIAVAPGRSTPGAVLATGEALRRAVFDPLVEALGGRSRLLVAPDGDLSRLPFGVLPTPEGRLVIEDYDISYINCGRDVLRFGAATTVQPAEPLLAADPDFDFGGLGARATVTSEASQERRSRDLDASLRFPVNRLEGTRREGEQIAGMLGIKPWLEGDFVEGRLKEECRSPSVLHLATHGFFLEDQHRELRDDGRGAGLIEGLTDERSTDPPGPLPENPLLRSGLILAGVNTWHRNGRQPLAGIEDGLLTAEDVTGLNLRATELVVLSACDTGLGEVHTGEGVFGLQRAFILAGAKTLIMSLWKVPDQQTQELMVDFYTRLLAGEGKAEALRNAQLAMKAKYPDPYYWGAFVCLGDPGPLKAVPTASASSSEPATQPIEPKGKP